MKCEKLIKTTAAVALILFIAGAVIGTLAVPVVLSMFYSWYWLFLYAGYLLIILYMVLYCVRYSYEENALDGRVSDLVKVLKFIIRNCGFELVSRIEIKDVKTGRVFK